MVLKCPECPEGSVCRNHIKEIEVFSGDYSGETKPGVRVTSNEEGELRIVPVIEKGQIYSKLRGEPAVVFVLQSECTGKEWSLCVYHHMGSVYLNPDEDSI